jgi:hypothetical protein
MDDTDTSPAEPPAKTNRRRLVAGGVVAAAAVGIGFVVVKFAGRAASGGNLTHDVATIVQGHYKQQAYGPDWQYQRKIWISPYERAARAA